MLGGLLLSMTWLLDLRSVSACSLTTRNICTSGGNYGVIERYVETMCVRACAQMCLLKWLCDWACFGLVWSERSWWPPNKFTVKQSTAKEQSDVVKYINVYSFWNLTTLSNGCKYMNVTII